MTPPRPLVSVIVPAFNYGRFLAETLASVQAQTHEQWECIVVDDGSTDDTWQVALAAAHADPRIRYLRRCNGGLSAARNSGLRVARGVYVQLLDADDAIERHKLETQVDFLSRRPDVGIVYGGVRYFDSDSGAKRRGLFADVDWMPRISGDGERLLRTLLRANIMVVNSPLARRAVFDRVGPFDETLTSLEDWDYWLRCALAGVWLEYHDAADTRALVRVHRRSMSQNRLEMRLQQAKIRRALDPAATGSALADENRFQLSEELGRLGSELVADGDLLLGVRYLAEAAWAHHETGGRWAKQALRALLPF
ncbi:MAG TPA: glycosyltransferase family 2 protein [Polyangia bacterium]|jgi:glycosyltransferase involved in cell wall biosynthesis